MHPHIRAILIDEEQRKRRRRRKNLSVPNPKSYLLSCWKQISENDTNLFKRSSYLGCYSEDVQWWKWTVFRPREETFCIVQPCARKWMKKEREFSNRKRRKWWLPKHSATTIGSKDLDELCPKHTFAYSVYILLVYLFCYWKISQFILSGKGVEENDSW